MKRLVAVAGVIFIIGFGGVAFSQEIKKSVNFIQKGQYANPAVSLEEAKKKIENYIKGSKYVSQRINVCEGNRYYIGEVYTEGYENFDVIRKIYVDKITGDLYPTMAETFDYCYMVKK
ncbi:hypothetical protein [Persephonella sp.]